MEKREKIYEGKAKQIFALDDEAYLIMVYKDEATADKAISAAN
jgi:phosphoribosylaminoimidazole-succinocarboxamide synthase